MEASDGSEKDRTNKKVDRPTDDNTIITFMVPIGTVPERVSGSLRTLESQARAAANVMSLASQLAEQAERIGDAALLAESETVYKMALGSWVLDEMRFASKLKEHGISPEDHANVWPSA